MRYLLLFFIAISSLVNAKTICLNMIVKNESKVIERCLNSLKDQVDYWVIVDLGSTDGTQEIIKKCMKGKRGELYQKSFVNYGYNRSEAFELAKTKADYVMFVDADDEIKFDSTFDKKTLDAPYYFTFAIENSGYSNKKVVLVDSKLPWKWEGSVNEFVKCDNVQLDSSKTLNSIAVLSYQDGMRSTDPERSLKEAALLEKELEKDPSNTRNQFYLALSYSKADQKVLALKNYEKRLNMQGSEDERWYSLYSLAKLHDDMNYPSEVVTKEYCIAFQARPQRAEPLGCLALHHLKKGNFVLAYSIAVQALTFTKPSDCYFVENWHYDFGILCVYADSARCLGLKEQSLKAYNFLLEQKGLPPDVREKVQQAVKEMTA